MSSDKKYNGWTNYETWCVKLWMDNSESDYHYWSDAAREVAESDSTHKRLDLADRLKDTLEENSPELEGMWADLMSSALASVDWQEIAEHLLDDIELIPS